MREIKFRAWDPVKKKMINPGWWGVQSETGLMFENEANHLPFTGQEIVMQYTGLKDKNGKEIWEGDIVMYKFSDEPGVVAYGYNTCECCGWCYGFSTEKQEVRFDIAEYCETIGNIYENPELLKERTT